MKLKIELYRYGTLVFGKVLEQEFSPTESHWLSSDGRFKIGSVCEPQLVRDVLFVRGSDTHRHNKTFYCNFDTEEEALKVVQYIKQGVEEINADPINVGPGVVVKEL